MPVTSRIVHCSCVSGLSTRELWTGVANNVPPSPSNPYRAKTGHNVSNAYPELTNRWTAHTIIHYRLCFGSGGPRFFHYLSFTSCTDSYNKKCVTEVHISYVYNSTWLSFNLFFFYNPPHNSRFRDNFRKNYDLQRLVIPMPCVWYRPNGTAKC